MANTDIYLPRKIFQITLPFSLNILIICLVRWFAKFGLCHFADGEAQTQALVTSLQSHS